LGIRTWIIKALAILATVLLTGVSVALAGKIAFVGLIIPHMARFLSGVDYRWIIPVSGVLGGIFLATCDIVARFINYPFETPVGVITSLIGVPFFLYLIKTRGGAHRE
jgi:iron complex transport system permease protein